MMFFTRILAFLSLSALLSAAIPLVLRARDRMNDLLFRLRQRPSVKTLTAGDASSGLDRDLASQQFTGVSRRAAVVIDFEDVRIQRLTGRTLMPDHNGKDTPYMKNQLVFDVVRTSFLPLKGERVSIGITDCQTKDGLPGDEAARDVMEISMLDPRTEDSVGSGAWDRGIMLRRENESSVPWVVSVKIHSGAIGKSGHNSSSVSHRHTGSPTKIRHGAPLKMAILIDLKDKAKRPMSPSRSFEGILRSLSVSHRRVVEATRRFDSMLMSPESRKKLLFDEQRSSLLES
ncbi:hypothetical protein EDD18DRAFT_1113663 [Armillaria luteobubalina]|uniref:Uncharacterized protein n=1 Tax=Armillaria luteobubalina TaxID=153913 RepID=A0AA39PAR0_9AGAR|nr:hypothetical protein EDD18DRAFT_1113663 [Armillaria luteobubalina]